MGLARDGPWVGNLNCVQLELGLQLLHFRLDSLSFSAVTCSGADKIPPEQKCFWFTRHRNAAAARATTWSTHTQRALLVEWMSAWRRGLKKTKSVITCCNSTLSQVFHFTCMCMVFLCICVLHCNDFYKKKKV